MGKEVPRVEREYELMYVVRPDLDEDGLRGAVEAVQSLVEGQGGEISATTPWGKRRLAYEIAGLRDGHYVIVEFKGDGSKVKELERALRISDHVIRHMITIAVPKPPEVEGKEGRRGERAAGEDGDEIAAEADVEDTGIDDLGVAGDEDVGEES
jgi:small subunit ribosomal protein S6